MAEERETYIRIDSDVYDELKRIAEMEKRSLNDQIEYFLIKSIDRFIKKIQRETDTDDKT